MKYLSIFVVSLLLMIGCSENSSITGLVESSSSVGDILISSDASSSSDIEIISSDGITQSSDGITHTSSSSNTEMSSIQVMSDIHLSSSSYDHVPISSSMVVVQADSIHMVKSDSLIIPIYNTVDTVLSINVTVEYSALNPSLHQSGNSDWYIDRDNDGYCRGMGNGVEFSHDLELESCVCDPSVDIFQCNNANLTLAVNTPKIRLGSDDKYYNVLGTGVFNGDVIHTVTYPVKWYDIIRGSEFTVFDKLIFIADRVDYDYAIRIYLEVEYLDNSSITYTWDDLYPNIEHRNY